MRPEALLIQLCGPARAAGVLGPGLGRALVCHASVRAHISCAAREAICAPGGVTGSRVRAKEGEAERESGRRAVPPRRAAAIKQLYRLIDAPLACSGTDGLGEGQEPAGGGWPTLRGADAGEQPQPQQLGPRSPHPCSFLPAAASSVRLPLSAKMSAGLPPSCSSAAGDALRRVRAWACMLRSCRTGLRLPAAAAAAQPTLFIKAHIERSAAALASHDALSMPRHRRATHKGRHRSDAAQEQAAPAPFVLARPALAGTTAVVRSTRRLVLRRACARHAGRLDDGDMLQRAAACAALAWTCRSSAFVRPGAGYV